MRQPHCPTTEELSAFALGTLAEAALERLGDPDPKRVLMIGDSLDHDGAGARAKGMLTLLLGAGVHRDALAGAPDLQQAIRMLAGSHEMAPNWLMKHLTW